MAVKLEVIIYTDEKGCVLTQTTGSYSKDGASEKEFQVATRLHDAIKEMLNKEFNGVDLFSVGVEPCAHNTH